MKFRKMLALPLVVLLLLSFTACGKYADGTVNEMAPDVMDGVVSDMLPEDGYIKEEADSDSETSTALPENRKLIQTVNMTVETEDLDTVLRQIDSRIAELGGYVESSNVQNGSAYSGKRYRSADITVRIPAKDLDAFVNRVGEISNIVSSRKTVEDITLNYVATESRMKALQTEEARLLELLAEAKTMNDLLTVEKRLTEVRTELEQVTSALRVYDNQVNYATIQLDIDEVKEYTQVTEPETVWQRLGTGFMKSLRGVGNFFKELFVFVIVASPYFALIAAIIFGIVFAATTGIRRKKRKLRKEQKAKAVGTDVPDGPSQE